MLLKIRQDDNSPIYQQIIDQVKAQVADGTLRKGERLPSVRELARDININVNTIYKAYRELEVQGVLRMRIGSGATITAERQDRVKKSERERIIRDMVEHLRVEAYHLGFDDAYLISLLTRRSKERAG